MSLKAFTIYVYGEPKGTLHVLAKILFNEIMTELS